MEVSCWLNNGVAKLESITCIESLSPTPPTTITETWLISGETDGIVLCGDERELGAVFEKEVGLSVDDAVSSDATTVLPAPITITSSFDIARLGRGYCNSIYNKTGSFFIFFT